MTVDEALAIVEVVLDDQYLNKVQELVFRECWAGRSYGEIANDSGYETNYIKDVGAKLWKKLSKAFDEKVKKENLKAVIKRYFKKHQSTVNHNRVDLSGASLNDYSLIGANLNITKFCSGFSDSNVFQSDLQHPITPDDETQENRNQFQNKGQPTLNHQINQELVMQVSYLVTQQLEEIRCKERRSLIENLFCSYFGCLDDQLYLFIEQLLPLSTVELTQFIIQLPHLSREELLTRLTELNGSKVNTEDPDQTVL
ncbi:hypothetical protein [Planktothrix sp. FACHB-1365]|uniref:hypothetical protein n=1 Tax=Planktothrix sp. FACHB-1365 TaxID=2692855 RepID=UPI001685DB4E|nr:hypothetical protein [Planktothrix sp. FACHB-1365]MBD2481585.1 hypothetical protein [Planktothrix sp. FACHB-1365]